MTSSAVSGWPSWKCVPDCMVMTAVLVSGQLSSLPSNGSSAPVIRLNPYSDSYISICGLLGAPWLGQHGAVPNGLKVVGGPHCQPASWDLLTRVSTYLSHPSNVVWG